jgi:hypothetical protein
LGLLYHGCSGFHNHSVYDNQNDTSAKANVTEFSFGVNSGYLITQKTSKLSKIIYNKNEYSKAIEFEIPANRHKAGKDCEDSFLEA